MDNWIWSYERSQSKYTTITQQQAEEYLKEDLRYFEDRVNNKSYVPQTINKNQFDALVSFAFNLGEGNLRELCTANYPPGKKTCAHIAEEITDPLFGLIPHYILS